MPPIITGVLVWFAGFILAAFAIREFQKAGTEVPTDTKTVAMVDTGIFQYSRNPIYIGAHIGLLGTAIAFNSFWVLLMLIPFYIIIRWGVIAREERYMERRFGDDYLEYKSRVRRWI